MTRSSWHNLTKWKWRRLIVNVGIDCSCQQWAVMYNQRQTMELTAVLTFADEGGYVALNPETGTTTQGETVEEALANLQEATELYLTCQ